MFDIFLHIEAIRGDSRDVSHAGWIDVLDFDHAIQIEADPLGRVHLKEFTIHKMIDSASPHIYVACCNGKSFQDILLEVWRSGGVTFKIFEVKLDEVIISNVRYCTAKQENERFLVETIDFRCNKIFWSFTSTNECGEAAETVSAEWSVYLSALLAGTPATPPHKKKQSRKR